MNLLVNVGSLVLLTILLRVKKVSCMDCYNTILYASASSLSTHVDSTTARLPDTPGWNAVDHVTLSPSAALRAGSAQGLAPASQEIRHVVQHDMARCSNRLIDLNTSNRTFVYV